MNLFDLQAAGLGSKTRYPRPAEQIEAQNKQQQLIAMLEEQRLRNQAREGG